MSGLIEPKDIFVEPCTVINREVIFKTVARLWGELMSPPFNDVARTAGLKRLDAGEGDWHEVIDVQSRAWQQEALRYMKRTRRVYVNVNYYTGSTWIVKRRDLLQYLRQVDLPMWLRTRPVPPGTSPILRFRRYTPMNSA